MPVVVVADPEYGPSRCRACGAVIVWALSEAGRRMPVDVEPAPGGSLELYTEYFPDGSPVEPGVQRVRRRPPDRLESSPTWWPHWATCASPGRRPPKRLPSELRAQLGRLMSRKWGPLFGRGEDS